MERLPSSTQQQRWACVARQANPASVGTITGDGLSLLRQVMPARAWVGASTPNPRLAHQDVQGATPWCQPWCGRHKHGTSCPTPQSQGSSPNV